VNIYNYSSILIVTNPTMLTMLSVLMLQYKHAVYVQTCKLFADLERLRQERETKDAHEKLVCLQLTLSMVLVCSILTCQVLHVIF